MDTAVRSLTVMWDGSLVVAANNNGTCYVWRLLRGTQVIKLCHETPWFLAFPVYSFLTCSLSFLSVQTMTNFEPLHKLQAHDGYILKCLLSPEFCDPHRLASCPIWETFFQF